MLRLEKMKTMKDNIARGVLNGRGGDRRRFAVNKHMQSLLIITAALALAGCGGSRLSHDTIIAALNGTSTSSGAGGAASGGGSAAQGGESAQAGPGAATGGTSSSGAGGYRTGGNLPGTGSIRGGALGGVSGVNPEGALAPILLGNVGNYSGPAGSSLAGAEPEILVWAKWVNAHGGIAGHPVQVYTADDGGDPSTSLGIVRDMVENKHVIAFVGNQAILTMSADLPYFEQHNIPVVGGDMASPDWTNHAVLFPQGTTTFELLDGSLKQLNRAGKTKLAFIYCLEATQCTTDGNYVLNEGAAKDGETIVYSAKVSITQPDYTAQCLGAEGNGAQAVLFIMDSNSVERFAASCSRQQYHPQYAGESLVVTNQLASDPDLQGMLAPQSVFPWVFNGNAAGAEYAQANQQYAPDLELSAAAASSWASGQLLARAAQHIGAQPTSADIFSGLWALRGETLGGLVPPLTYRAHQPANPNPCYFLMTIQGGQWTAPDGNRLFC